MRRPKETKIGSAKPIITPNKAACDDDEDGEIKYRKGVAKAREMRRTSPLMYKEDIRRLSRAFEACLGGCRKLFYKVSFFLFGRRSWPCRWLLLDPK